MADESEKKSSGAGEELDGDWDKKEDTAPGGPKAKRASGSEPETDETADASSAKSSAKDQAPVDEQEDDDEDDEEDEEDEDDEEDEEDEDEDDEDARDSTDDGSSGPPRRSGPPEASDDWIPDWAPWAVLVGILAIGVAGGLGAFTSKQSVTETAADTAGSATPTATATAAATGTGTAPGAQMNAAQAGMIEARHLLVMYKGSMRAPDSVTRTKEEAKKRAQEALSKIKAGQAFDKVVAEYSDEPGAAARGGKLGRFRREQMVKPFSDAAFALKPGEVSGIVETSFGFHVIQRTQ
jgi:hypothetical protein